MMKRKISFKDKVKRQSIRYKEEYRKSGRFWHNSVDFDPDHYLDEKHKAIADNLFKSLGLNSGKKQNQKQKDFEILLANLFQQTRRPVKISLNRNNWKQTKYSEVSYFIIELVYLLNKKKLIEMKIGNNIPNQPSRMTRIVATDKLLNYFPEYRTGVVWKPSELVILRDNKGKLIDYKDTAETWRIRDILKLVNDVNEKADIRIVLEKDELENHKIQAFLRAIFIEKFTLYGRLHTRGYRHYQGLTGDQRKEITINGEPVVELDFSALHPNLLYAKEDIQYPIEQDPYSIIDARPEVRPFLKEILLCMLNAKDELQAEKAANYWLRNNPEEKEQLKSAGIKSARPLIDKFMEVHQPIAHYFCKGKDTGLRIMNKDAKIALDIVYHFAKMNIPILAIHDSFVVQKQYRPNLYLVMRKTYKKHTGFRIKIK